MEQLTIVISPSSLNNLQACARKYEYNKIRGLGVIGPKDEKLERGDLIHQVCDFYYRGIIAGGVHEELKDKAIDFGRSVAVNMDLDIEAAEYFLNTARDYLDYQQTYNWKPLYSEEPFSLLFYEDLTLKILLEGKLDLIIEFDGKTVWVDHKTQEKSSEPSPLENQFQAYAYAFRDLTDRGFINQIGLQKTLPPDRKFKLKLLTFKEANLDEWRENVIYHVKLLEGYIRAGFFPMNNASCKFCQYRDICKEPPNLRERMVEARYIQMAPHDLFGDKVNA